MQITTPLSEQLNRYLDLSSLQLQVTAANMANASAPGYTREIANWQENDSIQINGASYGTGARVTGASSQRDLVLEQRIQQQTQVQQATSARMTALQNTELIFNEATSTSSSSGSSTGGISDGFTQFFNALTQLQSSPSSNAGRQQVLSAATYLASSFQNAATQLDQQQAALDQQSLVILNQVNSLTASLAQLNQQIQSQNTGSDAGELEDQRQQDLAQLSSLIGIHQVQTENNGLTITTANGVLLVASSQAYTLGSGASGGLTHIYDPEGTDLTQDLTSGGGQLAGLLTARDQDIPQMKTALDTLAYGLGSKINSINQAGDDANGNTGLAIFSLPSSSTGAASAISVAITSPDQIAAAGRGLGIADNSNLIAMLNVQNAGLINGVSPTNFYSDFVSSLGSLVGQTSTLNAAQQASLTQLQSQRDSYSAVNLNDEAASLETLERSYQAASKMFSILDSVMAATLNLGVSTSVS